jgi:hypothetical protein
MRLAHLPGHPSLYIRLPIQASGPGLGSGSGSGSGPWAAHYGDPPPDGVSGICE